MRIWNKNFPGCIYLISKGGLGNQLFVFAYAHELAAASGRKIRIITSWHDSNLNRPNQLKEISKHCNHRVYLDQNRRMYFCLKFISRVMSYFGPRGAQTFSSFGIYHEPNLPAERKQMRRVKFVEGYFQDLKYFKSLESVISEIRLFVDGLKPDFLMDYSAAHLRRGDYLGEIDNFGLLSKDYYSRFFQEDGQLLICTDDEKLAIEYWGEHERLQILGPESISPWETIAILSRAKNLYIANSSLSWWAGVVQRSRHGVTYIPQPWFKIFARDDQRMVYPGMIQLPSNWENSESLKFHT